MASATATATMRKINSETDFAVQLLLAVSNASYTKQSSTSSSVPSSATVSLQQQDPTSDSDDTVLPQTPSVASSPAVQQKPPPSRTNRSLHDTTSLKYNREERMEALARFREKKRRRQFQKRVRYMVRKRLAETRPRYKGRFSKPPPGENYDDGTPGPPVNKKE